jgi:hypothetical protein
MNTCTCGAWDEYHGMRVALINQAQSELGKRHYEALDPHSFNDRRIISMVYAEIALEAMGAKR